MNTDSREEDQIQVSVLRVRARNSLLITDTYIQKPEKIKVD